MKTCCKCKTEKSIKDFGNCKTTKDGLNFACRECHNRTRRKWSKEHRKASNEALRRYHEANPEFKLWVGAKSRAAKNGKPFSIKRTDIVIPEFCPVFGLKLKFGEKHACDNSPSLDCIVPEKGYVPGNIAVISHKANTIKCNANAAELRAVADWVDKVSVKVDKVSA